MNTAITREEAIKLATDARELYLELYGRLPDLHDPDPILLHFALTRHQILKAAGVMADAVSAAAEKLPEQIAQTVSAEALEPIRRTVAAAALAPIAWLKITIAGLVVCICALAGLGAWGYVQGTGLIAAQQRQLNAVQEQLSAIAAERVAAGRVQAEADLLREQQQLAAAAKAEAARRKQEAAAAAERKKQEEEKARAAQAEAARARQAYNECRRLRAPYEGNPAIDPGLFYVAYPECEAILRKER